MTTELPELDYDLLPMLIWLHSKKHDELSPNGQWHRAWDAISVLCFGDRPETPQEFEHAVHDAIGIPTDNCSCEVCSA